MNYTIMMNEKMQYRGPVMKILEITPYGRLCQNYSASNTEKYSTYFLGACDDDEE